MTPTFAPAPCPACGAPHDPMRYRFVPSAQGFTRFAPCHRCGSASQHPLPPAAQQPGGAGRPFPALFRLLPRELRLRRLLAHLGPGGAILEYGCGDGAFLRYAAAALPSRRFIGFRRAEENHSEAGGPNLLLVQGDLPFLRQHLPPLGLVTLTALDQPEPLPLLRFLQQHLLSGGLVVGEVPAVGALEGGPLRQRPPVVFSQPGLQALLGRAGFLANDVRGVCSLSALALSLAALLCVSPPSAERGRSAAWLLVLILAAALATLLLLCGSPAALAFCAERPCPIEREPSPTVSDVLEARS